METLKISRNTVTLLYLVIWVKAEVKNWDTQQFHSPRMGQTVFTCLGSIYMCPTATGNLICSSSSEVTAATRKEHLLTSRVLSPENAFQKHAEFFHLVQLNSGLSSVASLKEPNPRGRCWRLITANQQTFKTFDTNSPSINWRLHSGCR